MTVQQNIKTIGNSEIHARFDTQAALNVMRVSSSRSTLAKIVEHSARSLNCDYSVLYAFHDGKPIVLASYGFTAAEITRTPLPSEERLNIGRRAFEFHDMRQLKEFRNAPLVFGPAGWRYCVGAPVKISSEFPADSFVSLICVDRRTRPTNESYLHNLLQISSIAADMLQLLLDSIKNTESVAPPVATPALSPILRDVAAQNGFSPAIDPVARFLFESLPVRKRLIARNGINYLAVRTWAKPVKAHQIKAFAALKQNPPAYFVDAVVEELADAMISVHGKCVNASVVAVPCGHSGPDCFSKQLAQSLARKLDLEHLQAFEDLAVKGTSHPKTNVKRPKMKLVSPPTKPVILVDDIATSGSHLEEAARLLSEHQGQVWPVAWVAA